MEQTSSGFPYASSTRLPDEAELPLMELQIPGTSAFFGYASTSSPDSDGLPAVERPSTSGRKADSSEPIIRTYIRPEFCAVCGETANGYHYEVPSCNGCKKFFRRSVVLEKKYECKKDGKCMSGNERMYRLQCRACRYNKCVAAGMNPLAMVANVNPDKNKLVKNILQKRQLSESSSECGLPEKSNAIAETKLTTNLSPTTENSIDRVLDQMLFLESKSETFRRSSYNPGHHFLTLVDALSGHSKLGFQCPEVDYHYVQWPLPMSSLESYGLPPTSGILKTSCRPLRLKHHAKMWKVMDMLCAIEYLKTMDFFHHLCDYDKVILVKAVALPCSLLLSAFHSYAVDDVVTRFPDGSTIGYAEHLAISRISAPHAYMLSRGLVRMLSEAELDRKEYVLLKALLICNDTLPDLTRPARTILTTERARFAKSMFHYVMAHRGQRNGPTAYVKMITIIDTITRMANTDKGLFGSSWPVDRTAFDGTSDCRALFKNPERNSLPTAIADRSKKTRINITVIMYLFIFFAFIIFHILCIL